MSITSISPVYAIDQYNTAATEVVGQPNFTTNTSNANGLWNPTDLASDGTKLFVGEYGCRVSVYNTPPVSNFAAKDYVVGQPDKNVTCGEVGVATDSIVWDAWSVATDGNILVIADSQNNRVLIWNTVPTESNQPADIVLGQPDMTSNAINNGGVSASSLNSPFGVSLSGTKLLVADTYNSRVLIWNTIPVSNNQAADLVIGQALMTTATSNNGGISASSLYYPHAAKIFGTKLYITDQYNNRVLIYNTIPVASHPAADIVLGQSLMTTGTSNNGGVSAHSLARPAGIFVDNDKLFITDKNNHRVLIWNTLPAISTVNADVVLGQPNMTSNTANNGGVSAHSFDTPRGVLVLDGKLYVTDWFNHRVLVWNTVPVANQVDANIVIGHQTFVGNNYNDGGYDGFSMQVDPLLYNGKLIALDWNNRILIWNDVNSAEYPLNPDVLIGQPDMVSNVPNYGGVTAHSFYYPGMGAICNGKLVVPDYLNSRVLIWNSIPTSNNQDADIVLGQPNMSSSAINNGGISAHSLYYPKQVACSGTKLLIADLGNNRVLIYNTFPTGNQADADLVIGQPNMTSGSVNNGGISAHSLNAPVGVATDGTQIYVSDYTNSRVLVFSSFPLANQADASFILGQPNATSDTVNNGGKNAQTLFYPAGITLDDGKVFVADSNNNRILGWNAAPTVTFQAADFVIGQQDFTSNTYLVTATTLITPTSASVFNNKLYVADSGNSRILVYPFGPQSGSVTAEPLITSPLLSLTLSAQGAKEVIISEESDLSGASWEAYNPSKTVVVSASEGEKNIYVKYKDYANYEGEVLSATTILDESGPTGSVAIVSPTSNGKTATRAVTLSLSATDSHTAVSHMMISESADFAGAIWVAYTTTGAITLSNGDGVKTVYAKFKDSAENESSVYSATITLDMLSPSIRILSLGLLTDIPDKVNVVYYFTSQTPFITGATEANSTVHFVYGVSDYMATANSQGDFYLTIPELPREHVVLTYYAVDTAGNQSIVKTIKLIIGEENFPVQPTVTPSIGVTQVIPPVLDDPVVVPTVFAFVLMNKQNEILSNTKVFINGQQYTSNAEGKIFVEKEPTSSMSYEVEINGQRVKGAILGDKIIAEDLPSVVEQANDSSRNWLILFGIVSLLLVAISYFTVQAKKKRG